MGLWLVHFVQAVPFRFLAYCVMMLPFWWFLCKGLRGKGVRDVPPPGHDIHGFPARLVSRHSVMKNVVD